MDRDEREATHLIARIDIAECSLPLMTPVQLGKAIIAQRTYVVLRLALAGGSTGFAYGYDRGMPLFDLVLAASKGYLGGSADARNGLRRIVLGPTPAPRPSMLRGVSLCDIALWDAWCRAHELPLWRVLGGARASVPVMPVIGYGMTPERAAEDGRRLAAEGYRIVKLMIDGTDFQADRDVVAALADSLPPGVAFGIDAHWSWSHLDEALPHCLMAQDLGARFVEDPFAPNQWRLLGELAGRLALPLAVGEDVIDLAAFRDLSSAAGIIRIDAAASGGIGAALEAIALARAFDRAVIPHVFAPLHLHLGLAQDAVRCIEMISPELGADPIENFLLRPIATEAGEARATEEPGAGLAVDWPRLEPFMTRRERLTP